MLFTDSGSGTPCKGKIERLCSLCFFASKKKYTSIEKKDNNDIKNTTVRHKKRINKYKFMNNLRTNRTKKKVF